MIICGYGATLTERNKAKKSPTLGKRPSGGLFEDGHRPKSVLLETYSTVGSDCATIYATRYGFAGAGVAAAAGGPESFGVAR